MTSPPVASERWIRRGGRIDQLTRLATVAGFSGLIGVALVTMADVVLRGAFNAPIEGLEDVTRYVFAVAIASCLPAGLLQGHNVTIRFVGAALGRHAWLWLEALGAIACLAFMILLAWRFAAFTYDEAVNGRFTLILSMPTAPWWAIVAALIAFGTGVQAAVVLVRFERARAGRVAGAEGDHLGEPPGAPRL